MHFEFLQFIGEVDTIAFQGDLLGEVFRGTFEDVRSARLGVEHLIAESTVELLRVGLCMVKRKNCI